MWGRGIVLLALGAACVSCAEQELAPEDVGEQSAALTTERTLTARNEHWQVSATGGDRGTAWRDPAYRYFDFPGWELLRMPVGYGETYVTPISSGPDANAKPPTVYVLHSFYVFETGKLKSLRLEAMYDDGFVAYVNGVEVKRVSMPAGPVSYGTLAVSHEAGNAYESFDLTPALGAVHDGFNVVAVEVHQQARSSSDLVFDAAIYGQLEDTPPAPTPFGIPRRSDWSFWDAGGDLGTAWAAPAYDVEAWRTDQGPFGYGETYLNRIVSYGPSATNKHVTTYFRRDFLVDDPAAVTGLHGELMYDDGVIVYLNGRRIGTASMPSVATGTTLALGHEAGNAYEPFDWTAQRALLVAGVNTLAVEVHQQSRSSSDLVFDASLTIETSEPVSANGTVPARSTWRTWDRGGDLGTAWRARTYADGTWATGAGPLGYGESYLATPVGYGPSASSKYVTTYFRKTFDVALPDGYAVTSMIGEVMYDDGVVIYLNGQELRRLAMPTGAIAASTAATGHEAGDVYERFDFTAAARLIVPGQNVLAVEVHQVSASSSDLVFDLALDVKVAPIFVKNAENPIVNPSLDADPFWRSEAVYSPHVIHVGPGSWVMYFTGTDGGGPHDTVGRAVSTDGVHFTLDAADVTHGDVQAALFDGTTYRLYTSFFYDEGYALLTSTDGINFEHQGIVFPWESAVIIADEGVFKAWFGGGGYATSPDGVTWTRQADQPTAAVFSAVLRDEGVYKAWYADDDGCRYATSPDGLTWSTGGTSLAPGGPTSWDRDLLQCDTVLRDGPQLRMWYSAHDTEHRRIGTATFP